jgi:hypothetical protein
MFRLNVNSDHGFTHLLFKCVLDTVANVVEALCGDLTFHHDRGLKTFKVAKD